MMEDGRWEDETDDSKKDGGGLPVLPVSGSGTGIAPITESVSDLGSTSSRESGFRRYTRVPVRGRPRLREPEDPRTTLKEGVPVRVLVIPELLEGFTGGPESGRFIRGPSGPLYSVGYRLDPLRPLWPAGEGRGA